MSEPLDPEDPRPTGPRIVAVHRNRVHHVSKRPHLSLHLIAGFGVEGDAHAGETVQHRSRAARDPDLPNLRQVHLIHAELLDELAERGFELPPGRMGENVTTRGLDLLALPCGARLHLGEHAIVELSGLRNPCSQLNGLQEGLMDAVLDRDGDGRLIRKSGVMGIVTQGGHVHPGDPIGLELPEDGGTPLLPV